MKPKKVPRGRNGGRKPLPASEKLREFRVWVTDAERVLLDAIMRQIKARRIPDHKE